MCIGASTSIPLPPPFFYNHFYSPAELERVSKGHGDIVDPSKYMLYTACAATWRWQAFKDDAAVLLL